MVFGSVLARLLEFRLDAADGQSVMVRNTVFTRFGLKLLGIPHMGLRIRASLILNEIMKLQPKTIIDAGSGNGLYTLEFAARGFVVHGIELNHDKVSRVGGYAQEAKLTNASLQIADLTNPVQLTRKADLIVCSDVLEHISDDVKAVSTLAAIINSGGTLILTVPRISSFATRVENSFDHVRSGYSEEHLQRMLEKEGFQVVKTKQFFKMFGRMAWSIDRRLRHSAALKAIFFWPLYLLAKLDALIPDDNKAGGIFMVARASSESFYSKLENEGVV